jgi:hypothetical protein
LSVFLCVFVRRFNDAVISKIHLLRCRIGQCYARLPIQCNQSQPSLRLKTAHQVVQSERPEITWPCLRASEQVVVKQTLVTYLSPNMALSLLDYCPAPRNDHQSGFTGANLPIHVCFISTQHHLE